MAARGSERVSIHGGRRDEMRGLGFLGRSWRPALAALGASMAIALAPAQAGAQTCGEFDDIAEGIYGFWGDQFEDFFPIGDEDVCGPFTGKFQAACENAVKDAVKCWNKRVGEIAKAAKLPCGITKNPGDCKADFKESEEVDRDDIEQLADDAVGDCEDAADGFFDFCMFP
jgi:hypothetical protein